MPALKRICVLALVLLLAGLAFQVGPTVRAQDGESEEDPTIETTRTARVQTDDEEEPVDEEAEPTAESNETDIDSSSQTEGESPNVAAIDVEDIYQTIAQGLAAFDEMSNGIWRITELEPLGVDEAPSVIAPYYGFLYQMDGTTIVRNDNTGKRARLEPGEAYYFSANDTYTRYREDDTSRAWLIEVVPDDFDESDTAGTVIYTSEEIGSLPDDTRDMELISANLIAGEVSELPDFEVDILIMVTLGTINVTDEDGTTEMIAPAAMLFSSDVILTNDSDEPAVYAIAKIGPSVGDAAPAETSEEPSEETDEETADESTDDVDPMLDTDSDGLIDTDELVYGTDSEIADTDFDGYSDGDEVITYGTDPLDAESWP